MKCITLAALLCLGLGLVWTRGEIPEGKALREALSKEAEQVGRPQWRAMLLYLAKLHGESVFPAQGHFKYPYESIGAGYQGGRVFGHIDLAHERLDVVRAAPEHVRNQTRNELAGQQPDGLIPGVINFDNSGKAWWKPGKGFPPFWVASVDAYVEALQQGKPPPVSGEDGLAAMRLEAAIVRSNREGRSVILPR